MRDHGWGYCLRRLWFLGFVLVFVFPYPAMAQGHAAKEALETFLETIRAIEFPVQDPVHHEKLVRQAHALLDLESMVKAALEAHWDESDTEFRETFLELMWRLIEHVAYARSHDFLGDVEITYPEIKAHGDHWVVRSVVAGEEKALDVDIVYHLYEQEDQWKIDDVILDGVSMIEDLHYQFDKIIRESSFSGLLERMRNKLEKAEKENQGDPS